MMNMSEFPEDDSTRLIRGLDSRLDEKGTHGT